MRHDVEASRELETVLIHKCVSLYETHYYISVDQRVTELLDIEKSSGVHHKVLSLLLFLFKKYSHRSQNRYILGEDTWCHVIYIKLILRIGSSRLINDVYAQFDLQLLNFRSKKLICDFVKIKIVDLLY